MSSKKNTQITNKADFSDKNEEKLQKLAKKDSKNQKESILSRKKKPYRVDIRMPNGKRVTKTFHRKYDAEKFKAEALIKKHNINETGTDIDKDLVFKNFVDYWFKVEVIGRKAVKTQKCYESDLKNYVLPILGHIKLRHLSYSHARLVENSIIKVGKSNRTVNKVMMELKTVINDAVKHGFLLKSPFRGYPELKEEPRPINYWSKDEVLKFLEANKDDYFIDLYKVALNTGLRLGEICGLCWDKVNFESKTITISRTLTREGLKNTTKSHKARYIPMNESTRTILAKRFKIKTEKYVFHMEDKRPITYDHFSQRQFKQAQIRADIGRFIRFHDIRHTYASHFIMNGGDIFVLQKLLGHSDMNTTLIYAHLSEKFLRQASEIINF